jgi:hypothetical protein
MNFWQYALGGEITHAKYITWAYRRYRSKNQ